MDECPQANGERVKLLNIISQVHLWNKESLHVLATSRNENDINNSFLEIPRNLGWFEIVEVERAQVQHDVEIYLQKQFERGPFKKLERRAEWKLLKQDIIQSLVSQADGM